MPTTTTLPNTRPAQPAPTRAEGQTWAARSAFAAALLFALHLATYFVPALRDATLAQAPLLVAGLVAVGVAQHLVVFPVVAALRAPGWARLVGYGWLVVDTATEVMQLAGTDKSLYLTLRLAVNVAAAVWLALAAWQGRGAFRLVGLFVAADFALYSFAATLDPRAFLLALPSLLLLPLWFALAGRRLASATSRATSRATPRASGI